MKKYLIISFAAIAAIFAAWELWIQKIISPPGLSCLTFVKTVSSLQFPSATFNYQYQNVSIGNTIVNKLVSITYGNTEIDYNYNTSGHIIEKTTAGSNAPTIIDYTLGTDAWDINYPISSNDGRRFDYNTNGQLILFKDPGGTNKFNYNGNGQLISWKREGGASPAQWTITPSHICNAYNPMGPLLEKWSSTWPLKMTGIFDNGDTWPEMDYAYPLNTASSITQTITQNGNSYNITVNYR